MLGNIGQFWALVGFGAHVMGAIAAATAAAWLLGRRKGFGDAWPAVALGLGLTAAWCLVIAVLENEVTDTESQHIWSLMLPELYVLFLEVRQGHNKLVLGFGDH